MDCLSYTIENRISNFGQSGFTIQSNINKYDYGGYSIHLDKMNRDEFNHFQEISSQNYSFDSGLNPAQLFRNLSFKPLLNNLIFCYGWSNELMNSQKIPSKEWCGTVTGSFGVISSIILPTNQSGESVQLIIKFPYQTQSGFDIHLQKFWFESPTLPHKFNTLDCESNVDNDIPLSLTLVSDQFINEQFDTDSTRSVLLSI